MCEVMKISIFESENQLHDFESLKYQLRNNATSEFILCTRFVVTIVAIMMMLL